MDVPDMEAAIFFQQNFEPPVGSRDGGREVGTTLDLQEATAEASRSSSSGVHGTTRG